MKNFVSILLFSGIFMACILSIVFIVGSLLEKARVKSNSVHIKMHRIGNQAFHLNNIKTVRGVNSFPRLRGQIGIFKSTVEEITSKITQYELTDYYKRQRRLQKSIDAFCDNLRKLDAFLKRNDSIYIQENDGEIIQYNENIVYEAVKNTLERNRSIVRVFINLDLEITRSITEKS